MENEDFADRANRYYRKRMNEKSKCYTPEKKCPRGYIIADCTCNEIDCKSRMEKQ